MVHPDYGSIRARLLAQRPAFGCNIAIPSLMTADIIGRAGYAFAVVNVDHGAIGVETLAGQLMALAYTDTVPLVRAGKGAHAALCAAVNLGAAGVVASNIEGPEEVAAVIEAISFPPEGARGASGQLFRASSYGADIDYAATWNQSRIVVARIDSPRGVEASAEIARVDGVDALLFGPTDFSARAGFPGGADVARALDIVVQAANEVGIRAGGVPFPGVSAEQLRERGADFSIIASDVTLLQAGAKRSLNAVFDN
jgi:4-hydroxy-2-oxoheptanedioate aldolase